MSVSRAQRIHEGLTSLVDRLIPPEEAANEAEADEIHDNALDLAQRIVDRWIMLIGASDSELTLVLVILYLL